MDGSDTLAVRYAPQRNATVEEEAMQERRIFQQRKVYARHNKFLDYLTGECLWLPSAARAG